MLEPAPDMGGDKKVCRNFNHFPTRRFRYSRCVLAREFAARFAFMVCLSLVTMAVQHRVVAAVLSGKHYSIEFENADRESAKLVGGFIDGCWNEVARSVGADAESPPVRVIMPGSLDEFRKFAGGHDARWVVGLAGRTGSLIVVKPPRLVSSPFNSLRQTVRHELTHIMLSRVSSVQNLPRWLNEGIALRVSGEMARKSEWIISGAILRGALIPLDELDERFPAAHERASLAYAESLKAVNYIADTYGEEALLRLIRSLRDQDFDTALAASVGLDLHTLSERWIRTVRISPYVVTLVCGSLSLWLMTVLVILAFLRKRRLARRKRWEWEMEEALGDDL